MASLGRIRILCVDDRPLVRDGIAFAVQQQTDMELAAEANNGADAVETFRRVRADVTLMDLQMPEMNGIEATAAILKALKLGAPGYLLKGTLRTELIDTIRSVHSGQRRLPAEIASGIAEHYTRTIFLHARLKCCAAWAKAARTRSSPTGCSSPKIR